MCIVFFTQAQPGYKLILAANRDEFLERPTLNAAWHNFDLPSDDNAVLCGRDLGHPDKGTWLGLTKDLRIGVLTNIRYPLVDIPPNCPSRGKLMRSWLSPSPTEAPSVTEFSNAIDAPKYAGFNVLLFQLHKKGGGHGTHVSWGPNEIAYLSNRPGEEAHRVSLSDSDKPVGMSNTPLMEPYPKVTQGESHMTQLLAEWETAGGGDDALVDRMMELLSPSMEIKSYTDMMLSTTVPPFHVDALRDTVDLQGQWYGTRLATVLIVKDDGQVIFVERDIGVLKDGRAVQGDIANERRFCFDADPSVRT